jgi:hypothetical protein
VESAFSILGFLRTAGLNLHEVHYVHEVAYNEFSGDNIRLMIGNRIIYIVDHIRGGSLILLLG